MANDDTIIGAKSVRLVIVRYGFQYLQAFEDGTFSEDLWRVRFVIRTNVLRLVIASSSISRPDWQMLLNKHSAH